MCVNNLPKVITSKHFSRKSNQPTLNHNCVTSYYVSSGTLNPSHSVLQHIKTLTGAAASAAHICF